MSGLGNKEIMARNIKKYMELNNKTRNDMCEALGVKYTTFTDWVNGNAYPRIDKIELMADFFGVLKSDLIEDKSRQDDELSTDERILIEWYRNAPEHDRDFIRRMIAYSQNIKNAEGR